MATATAQLVSCENCGRKNRVSAAAAGVPRCGNCRSFLPWIVDATDEDFAEVAERVSVPVLVDLWASWCPPCGRVSPLVEQLARERAGRLKLVKVDVDRAPRLSRRFAVQSVPTLLVMHRGEVIANRLGAAPVNELRSWLDAAIARISSATEPQTGGTS